VGGGRIYLLSGRERGDLGRCPGDRSRFGFPAKAFSDDRDIGEADEGEHVSHDGGLPNSGYIPTLSIGFADRLVRGAVLICAPRTADDAWEGPKTAHREFQKRALTCLSGRSRYISG
jgi:hypothetical protein